VGWGRAAELRVEATAISDLSKQDIAAEDDPAMSSDPESALPEAETVSAEVQPQANQTDAENLAQPPVDHPVWRERGEELAPAIYVSVSGARPEAEWENESPALASPERVARLETETKTVPDVGRACGEAIPPGEHRWYLTLLGLWLKNYKGLCRNLALIALGALMALLAVGFAHRRSPFPVGLRRPATIRPEAPSARARRNPAPRAMTGGTAKSVAREKITEARENITDLKSPRPAAVVKIEPGKVSLASAQQRVLSKSRRHSNFSSEANVVAPDTVTRYVDQSVPPPK
jgi:hypothetical protein